MKTTINQVSKTIHPWRIVFIGTITGAITLLFAFTPMQQSKEWNAPPEANKKTNPVASNEKSIADGKIIYTKNCVDCHGKKGKGDGPKSGDLDVSPPDFSKEKFQKQSDGSLFWKTTEGRKPMPGFKKDLTEEQRWQVVNYMRTLEVKKK